MLTLTVKCVQFRISEVQFKGSYHIIISPIVADVRVRQKRRLIDHGQPEGTTAQKPFQIQQTFINASVNC